MQTVSPNAYFALFRSLVAIVLYEQRTQVNAILGYAELILDDDVPSGVSREANKLATIANSLTDIPRLYPWGIALPLCRSHSAVCLPAQFTRKRLTLDRHGYSFYV